MKAKLKDKKIVETNPETNIADANTALKPKQSPNLNSKAKVPITEDKPVDSKNEPVIKDVKPAAAGASVSGRNLYF